MSFWNIGPWELMLILAIAVLLIGPKRVVEIARTIGRITSQMRRLSDEFVGTIQAELLETERETRQALEDADAGEPVGGADVQGARREARQAMQEISAGLGGLVRGQGGDEERAG